MKIGELLKTKDRAVVVIGPEEAALAAVQRLVENNIGALPVCDAKGTLLGIVSERDLLKQWSQRGKEIGGIRVKDMMTRDVAIGIPEDDLDYATSIMTQKGIRHLPIMVGQKLEGMVSMRDIVEAQLEESKAQVRYLGDYISGGYV